MLRPALREAAHALRIAAAPTTVDGERGRPSPDADRTWRGDGLPTSAPDGDGPSPEADEQSVDGHADGYEDEPDDEAAAVAELGQLLDALTEAVTVLAQVSRDATGPSGSPRG